MTKDSFTKLCEKTLVEYCCPISLLSTFSKLIENTLLFSIFDNFKHYNILQDFQHGFRVSLSTTSAGKLLVFNFKILHISGQNEQESDPGLVFYKIDLHKEVEEPRLQAEV